MLALAALGTSSGAVLVRLAAVPPPAAAFWRLAFSVLALTPLLLVSGQWRELRRPGRAKLLLLPVTGLLLALHFVVWFRSLELTSVATSTVLVATHPLFVGALSERLLGERPALAEWVGIGIAVAGTAIVGWDRHGPGSLTGAFLAVLAALLVALYFLAGRGLRADLGVWAYVVPVYAVAALVAAGFALAQGVPLAGYRAKSWWALVGLAAGPTLLGHTGFNWALRYVRAYVTSVVQLFEPVGATILAVLVLGRSEMPGWRTLVGGTAILVGVWLPMRRSARRAASQGRRREEGGEL
jgi:drug/metabolite transporter (DMT)-like permease